jgi:ABC-type lipopolysaccharide export system ATPase subunit
MRSSLRALPNSSLFDSSCRPPVLRLADAIKTLRTSGVGMLVAEQNVKFTGMICQRWYAIDKGHITPVDHAAISAGPQSTE